MPTLNINTDAVVSYTNQLEKLHRSGLPVAIRSTLNSAAFDVKTKSMPKQAAKAFKNRKKNFFRSNSKVKPATGFNIKTMKSVTGFVSRSAGKGKQQAVENLEKQERRGTISGRKYITNRKGKNAATKPGENVSLKNRTTAVLPNVIKVQDQRGGSWAQKSIIAAAKAKKGGYVSSFSSGSGMGVLFRVQSIKRKSNGNTRFKRKDIYYTNKSGKVTVKRTNFMGKSGAESSRKLGLWYKKESFKQIKRLKNK